MLLAPIFLHPSNFFDSLLSSKHRIVRAFVFFVLQTSPLSHPSPFDRSYRPSRVYKTNYYCSDSMSHPTQQLRPKPRPKTHTLNQIHPATTYKMCNYINTTSPSSSSDLSIFSYVARFLCSVCYTPLQWNPLKKYWFCPTCRCPRRPCM